MAPQPRSNTLPSRPKPQKRNRLPENALITKRPLLHPPVPAPRALEPTTIYLRTNTPFIPTMKRIRTLLGHIASRNMQSHLSKMTSRGGHLNPKALENATIEELRAKRSAKAALQNQSQGKRNLAGRGEEGFPERDVVYVRAAGRAIEKCLNIANRLGEKGDVKVLVRTGTVSAVDELEESEDRADDTERMDGVDGKEQQTEEGEELPEARIRQISYVELVVTNA